MERITIHRRGQRPLHLEAAYCGDQQISVFLGKNKEPHFTISGADIERLDPEKVADYIFGCDWTDRGSPGYITPDLRCDGFLKTP